MKELVAVLLTWISLQLAVEPPAAPEIEFVPQRQLLEMAYGESAPADASVTAIYNPKTRTVYLGIAWKHDDLRDRSTLLHELVHHFQECCALPYPCLAARERDAYHLQAAWLRQNGVPQPYAFLGIDEFTVAVISMCRDE
jgi:hypothetical protein